MSESEQNRTVRLAVHSTHEAAEKIAGIGAVLDGILPQASYQEAFPSSLLAGAYPFAGGTHPLKEVVFDSDQNAGGDGPGGELPARLARIAEDFGTRIVFGRRAVGTRDCRVPVDVLLVCPSGIKRSKLDGLRWPVRDRFGFDLTWYEDHYAAVSAPAEDSLERILRYYECLRREGGEPPYPPYAAPPSPLYNHRGQTFYGGVPFAGKPNEDPSNSAALFPSIPGLDTFNVSDKTNAYLLELEFYFYAALPLWMAARVLIDEVYRPSELAFFAHDWLGIPLFWAMRLEEAARPPEEPRTTTSVYFAHEARIARLLVEGMINDKAPVLEARCHPDGHDVSFYAHLARLEKTPDTFRLDEAFPELRRGDGKGVFDDIFYHAVNRQAEHFDHVVAVGENVRRETELILGGAPRRPSVSLCPNGIPDFTAGESSVKTKLLKQQESRERLVQFCKLRFGFSPDVIFTAVNRCELSKGPWRNVEFFRSFVEAEANQGEKSLFIWLSRPRPLPTAEQIACWSQWGWPLEHRPQEEGGDLRREEVFLWEMIRNLNEAGKGSYRMLYINQFGWSREKLGALDPAGTSFLDLRVGTDVEVGLSIYEPFGIAPLEPFSTGAVCALSDSCGCALHLAQLLERGLISDEGYVTGKFARPDVDPAKVDLKALRGIESEVYSEMIAQLIIKLAMPRAQRLAAAQKALPHLSWGKATGYLLEALHLGSPVTTR